LENVENLSPGSLILSNDGSYKELRVSLRTSVTKAEINKNPKLKPVRISAGALGHGLPTRDLLVSRQHRMLGSSPIAKRMFGNRDVLISAIKLTSLPGIFVDDEAGATEYFHLVFDDHEVIWAEGAASESFYTGQEALATLSEEAREELFTLFPDLSTSGVTQATAWFVPDNKRQKMLIARHSANNKPLYDPLT